MGLIRSRRRAEAREEREDRPAPRWSRPFRAARLRLPRGGSYFTYVQAGDDAPLTRRGVRWLTILAVVLAIGATALWVVAFIV